MHIYVSRKNNHTDHILILISELVSSFFWLEILCVCFDLWISSSLPKIAKRKSATNVGCNNRSFDLAQVGCCLLLLLCPWSVIRSSAIFVPPRHRAFFSHVPGANLPYSLDLIIFNPGGTFLAQATITPIVFAARNQVFLSTQMFLISNISLLFLWFQYRSLGWKMETFGVGQLSWNAK